MRSTEAGERLEPSAHLARVRRRPTALFCPQLEGKELSKAHKCLFQRHLRCSTLGSFLTILRLGAAFEAK